MEIVKYHNDLNGINTRTWTADEMNIFFTIVAKLRESNSEMITLDADDFKGYSVYADRSQKELKSVLDRLGERILSLVYREYHEDGKNWEIIKMNLFEWYKVRFKDDILTLEVQSTRKFSYVFNKLNANFTMYELAEFSRIVSPYAKTLYRLLKQFRQTGKRQFNINEYRELMGFPDTYTTRQEGQKTKAVLKLLQPYFEGLEVETLTKGRKKTGYLFTWKPTQANKYLSPDEYKKAKQTNKNSLPDWYENIPEGTATPEQVAEALKLQEELLNRGKE